MTLNDEEQDIMAGKSGRVAQQALQHQLKVGEFFSAKDFVPVTQAHIMADTESLGEAGTVRQHNQHPIPGTHAEFSQRSGDRGRLFG